VAGAPKDPLSGFHFGLDAQGINAFFTELSGMDSKTQSIENHHVDNAGMHYILKTPGNSQWGDLTLKRLYTDDQQLWNWRQQVIDGDIKGARRDCSISAYNTMGAIEMQITVKDAWPSAYTGPSLNAKGNDAATEQITLTHHGIKRIK